MRFLVLCEPAQSKCTWTCHKRYFMQKFTGKLPEGASRGPCFVRGCAVENAPGHVTSAILCRNLKGNCQTPQPAPLFRAGLRNRNAHGHVTRAVLCGNLQGNCQTAPAGVPVSCAVEMHMDMSQEPFYAEIDRENCEPPGYHLE